MASSEEGDERACVEIGAGREEARVCESSSWRTIVAVFMLPSSLGVLMFLCWALVPSRFKFHFL
jgi:hypothetical protein